MTEEYFKSEEFYNIVLKACNYVFARYYKTHTKDKEDMIAEAVVDIYAERDKYNDLKDKELFYRLCTISKNAFQKYSYIESKNNYAQCFSLDEGREVGEGYDLFSELVSKDGFQELKKLLIEFVNNYDADKSKIAFKYFSGKNCLDIMKELKKRSIDVIAIIREFRSEFAAFLKQNQYFVNDNVLKKEDEFTKSKKDKCIYLLIREKHLEEDASKVLGKDISDTINHKRKGRAHLFLFEIQKLRDKYFIDYTLEELAKDEVIHDPTKENYA